jgi:ribosomal protein L37AE/L43A
MKKAHKLCTCGGPAVARIGFGIFCRECASEAMAEAPSPIASMQDRSLPSLYDVATGIAQRKAEANGFADVTAWMRGES